MRNLTDIRRAVRCYPDGSTSFKPYFNWWTVKGRYDASGEYRDNSRYTGTNSNVPTFAPQKSVPDRAIDWLEIQPRVSVHVPKEDLWLFWQQETNLQATV